MKYSYMLLITLVISTLWGLLLFLLGCIIRFHQTMMVNRYIADLDSKLDLDNCMSPNPPQVDICPIKKEFEDIRLGDWADLLGSITIVTGFIIILLSACGLFGVMKRSQALLLTMLVLIILAIGLEYYLLDIVLGDKSNFHVTAKDELVMRLESEYSLMTDVNDFTRMMNAVMLKAECCGIDGPNDFRLNETFSYRGRMYKLKLPPACCKQEHFSGENGQDGFLTLLECSTEDWSSKGTLDGCFTKVQEETYKTYGGPLVGFLMFLILWEGVQGILLFMIILRPTPKSPKKSLASSTGSQRSGPKPTPQEPLKKKFIPFSQVSAMVSDDINRVKSTEIW